MKAIGISAGEPRSRSMHHRIADVYEQIDRERMEWLNAQIAAEIKPKKYSYKRKHPDTPPGEICQRCGRTTGLCIAAMHRGQK
jgi:hypothetical protein